ncbi:hypothetical protein GGP52_002983 [Salinibacter ruber]|nr:hypothetical protein [Salinibacter ruber]
MVWLALLTDSCSNALLYAIVHDCKLLVGVFRNVWLDLGEFLQKL